jgi:poly(3-hydroxybutyrate) depolymerase
MVNYAKQQYHVDTNRVYVSGVSSGAMMTNVLAAEYPDVFKASSAFMGVPAGCFGTTDGSTCRRRRHTTGRRDAIRAIANAGSDPVVVPEIVSTFYGSFGDLHHQRNAWPPTQRHPSLP